MCKFSSTNEKLFNLYNITPDLKDRVKMLSYELVSNSDYESKETEIYKSLMEKFKSGQISIEEIKSMPDLPLWFLNDLTDYIKDKLKFGSNVTSKTKLITNANLDNYSIAKTYQFFKGLKNLATDKDTFLDEVISYSNLMLNAQQNVEDIQTERVTEVYTLLNNDVMCEYKSRNDSRVRDNHEHADGTILPASNKWWQTTGLKLLGEWSCRCSIVRSKETEPKQSYQSYSITPKVLDSNSKVNLKDSSVIIFKESLPMFKNVPSHIRRQYNRNGF